MNPVILRRILKRRRGTSGLPTSTFPYDTFESYSDGSVVNGLNLGVNGTNPNIFWLAPYVARTSLGIWVSDDFEGYADGANVSGLNGGSSGFGSWSSAYAARTGSL